MVREASVILSILLVWGLGLTQETHVVEKGETLWRISSNRLEDPFHWWQIYKANVDQIEDPHWIYPGQRFVIPPLGYEEAEVMEWSLAHGQAEREMGPGEAEMVAPGEEPGVPSPEVEISAEETVRVGLWKQQVPIVPPSLVYRAGYVTRERPEWAQVAAAVQTGVREILLHHEVLVKRGIQDGVQEGDFLTVGRIGKGVRHPRSGKALGKVFYVVGTLRVTAVQENSCRALVEECYESIKLGDIVIPFEEPIVPTGKELVETGRQVEGVIVAKFADESKLMPSEIVYIDRGKEDGIHAGDVFEVYRMGKKMRGVLDPTRVVGELQVLRVREETCSAVMTSIDNRLDLRVGELIRLRREAM